MSTLLEFFQNQNNSKIDYSRGNIASFRRVWCSYVNKQVSIIVITSQWKIVKHHCIHRQPKSAHVLKQTLENRLLVDISAIGEMVERNDINITWIEKTKQISDILTKAGPSPNILSGALFFSKMVEIWIR